MKKLCARHRAFANAGGGSNLVAGYVSRYCVVESGLMACTGSPASCILNQVNILKPIPLSPYRFH